MDHVKIGRLWFFWLARCPEAWESLSGREECTSRRLLAGWPRRLRKLLAGLGGLEHWNEWLFVGLSDLFLQPRSVVRAVFWLNYTKFTSSLEGSSLDEVLSWALVALDFSQGNCSWSEAVGSLLDSSANRSAFSGDFLSMQVLFWACLSLFSNHFASCHLKYK